MKYSSVIFDLDGTLLDTSKGIMNCVNYTIKCLNLPELTIEQQKNFIGPSLPRSFRRECLLDDEQAKAAVEIYRSRYGEFGIYEAEEYYGIKDLLINLKNQNCKMGIATLKRHDFAKKIIKVYGLTQYFASVLGVDDNDTYNKTDIILMCLKELGESDLSKVVFVGDSCYDAMGAEKAGIDFIAVTYGWGLKNKSDADEYKNVFMAESVSDIKKFLLYK